MLVSQIVEADTDRLVTRLTNAGFTPKTIHNLHRHPRRVTQSSVSRRVGTEIRILEVNRHGELRIRLARWRGTLGIGVAMIKEQMR